SEDISRSLGCVAINTASSIDIIRINDIIYCESHRNYCVLHFSDRTTLTVTKTLKQFEADLSDHHFVRIHQSYLVSINYMSKYIKSRNRCLMLVNGTELPVATRKKEHLLRQLNFK